MEDPTSLETASNLQKRNPDGTFGNGFVANPTGANGQKGWQRYSDRCHYLSEKYTPEQIHEYAENGAKRRKELSWYDGMCILHMARANDPELTRNRAGSDDLRGERKDFLDRTEGPVKNGEGLVALTNGQQPLIKIVFESNNSQSAINVLEDAKVIDQPKITQSSEATINVPNNMVPKIEFE